jgi:hypothetical protein
VHASTFREGYILKHVSNYFEEEWLELGDVPMLWGKSARVSDQQLTKSKTPEFGMYDSSRNANKYVYKSR